jgi:hypothetical protein
MTVPDDSNPGRDDMDLSGIDLSGIDLRRVWTGVAAEVWRRHPGRVERLATRLLRSPGLARALLTTPSLLLPWLISTVVVFVVGGAVTWAGEPLVWLIAPVIAAIGIAYAYGPGVDPAWELACSTAVSDRMVLLVRSVAVFTVNAFLGLAVSVASYWLIGPGAHGATGRAAAQAVAVTVAWLLPMTAVCAFTLAVAVATRSANTGAVAGVVAWCTTVLVTRAITSGELTAAVTNSVTYLPYLAVAACAAAVIGYGTRTQRGAL